jgi:hypothetical protein
MPNWSYNEFSISGTTEEMSKFYEIALKPNHNGDVSFKLSNIFPMPQKIKNTISPSSSAKGRKWLEHDTAAIRDNKISEALGVEPEIKLTPCENNTHEKCRLLKEEFGVDNWYDWNISNYGTKWDVEVLSESFYEKEETNFLIEFNTAWSPPENFLLKLQERFPNLDIKLSYTLEGSSDCGVYQTERYDGFPSIEHQSAETEMRSCFNDQPVYYCDATGEYKYHKTGEICEDVYEYNPLK